MSSGRKHAIEELRFTSSPYAGVYLVQFDNGVKVGITGDWRQRLKIYSHPWCRKILSVTFAKCFNPFLTETAIKRTYADNIVSNGSEEFITGISLEDIKLTLKNTLTAHHPGQWSTAYKFKGDIQNITSAQFKAEVRNTPLRKTRKPNTKEPLAQVPLGDELYARRLKRALTDL